MVNNSLLPHRSNNKEPLISRQLITVFEKYQESLEAIVYCPREETADLYAQLKWSTLVTIHVVKDIVSKRKQKEPGLLKENRALHQRPALELKPLTIVLAHKNNIRSLLTRSRPKKFSKRRRKTLFCCWGPAADWQCDFVYSRVTASLWLVLPIALH